MTPEVSPPTGRQVRDQVHPHCVVCSPTNQRGLGLVFALAADRSVRACFDCDETYAGFPGMLNGGTVSSLLDGAMANCLFLHGHVAAAHLGFHLGQHWRISSIGALQDDIAQAQVLATHLRQLSGIQQGADAAAHGIAHIWHRGVS